MARTHFSLAAPLPSKMPPSDEQALCTEPRRISRLGAWIKPSWSPQSLRSASAHLSLGALHALLLEKHQLLDKHMSQDRAIPSCSLKPVKTNLSLTQPSKQPTSTTAHDASLQSTQRDEGGKGKGKGPQPEVACSSTCTPTLIPHGCGRHH